MTCDRPPEGKGRLELANAIEEKANELHCRFRMSVKRKENWWACKIEGTPP